MNSRQVACDRSAFNATDRGHKPTITSLGIKEISSCAEHAPSGSGWLQLYHKHHHHRFMPHSCPHQFIQHVIEVYSAPSIAVYTIYVSQQNSRIACIKVAQALMRNCRCPPRTNLVLTSKWWISNTNVMPRSLVLLAIMMMYCGVSRAKHKNGWDVSHTDCPGIPWANGVALQNAMQELMRYL